MKTPYYVFDSIGFIENFESLVNAMRDEYAEYIPAYSYKTNYTPYICRTAKSLGAYAEVVSDMELSLALKLGYEYNNIIYNGPAKGTQLEKFLLNGGICNIDNLSEASRVIEFVRKHPEKQFKIGMRINVDIGAGFISRFGVDIDSDETMVMVKEINNIPNLKLVGLHLHVSRARYIEAWEKRIVKILEAADKLIEGVPEYIDLGSGMFGDMESYLKEQFSIKVPTYKEYAITVARKMANHYAFSSQKPMLFTEPGTTVVARYLSLFTTVIGVKNIRGYRMAIVDSDYHQIGETGMMMKCPYTIFRTDHPGSPIEPPLNIVGFTCLEQDILYKQFKESLSVGDVIEFRNIGGYSIVYKPPFIQPNCPIYVKDGDEFIEIKRAESFEDIFATFIF